MGFDAKAILYQVAWVAMLSVARYLGGVGDYTLIIF